MEANKPFPFKSYPDEQFFRADIDPMVVQGILEGVTRMRNIKRGIHDAADWVEHHAGIHPKGAKEKLPGAKTIHQAAKKIRKITKEGSVSRPTKEAARKIREALPFPFASYPHQPIKKIGPR